MATRGWESITSTDLAQRLVRLNRLAHDINKQTRAHKFRAEACIVSADGTLFTASQIHIAEAASRDPLTGTGTLRERAARVGISGQWFASTKEGKRYVELKQLADAGEIVDLRMQVAYGLTVNAEEDGRRVQIGLWIADFVYRRPNNPALITEDAKGYKTPLYLRSKKHFQAQYGLPIVET